MVIYENKTELREKMQKCEEYIGSLEEEFKKIQVFERELPLCLELISQAIERCKEQMNVRISGSVKGQFDDQTSSECPVLEEFIPMKSISSTNEDDDDDDDDDHMLLKQEIFRKSDSNDWLASAQLSIQAPNPLFEEDILSKKLSSSDENSNGCGTFHVFDQEKKPSISTLAEIGGGRGGDCGGDCGGGGGGKGQSNKKERRCWSQELHRRFLHAIQHLGGAHVATPKQIREFMKVDGLTNDEIKSHLQKYRLHTRRLSPMIHNTHTPQFVVVGRIWMPPLEYTTSAATSLVTDDIKNAKAVYAPITSLQQSITYKTKQCKQ